MRCTFPASRTPMFFIIHDGRYALSLGAENSCTPPRSLRTHTPTAHAKRAHTKTPQYCPFGRYGLVSLPAFALPRRRLSLASAVDSKHTGEATACVDHPCKRSTAHTTTPSLLDVAHARDKEVQGERQPKPRNFPQRGGRKNDLREGGRKQRYTDTRTPHAHKHTLSPKSTGDPSPPCQSAPALPCPRTRTSST